MNVFFGLIFILILGYIGSHLTERTKRLSLGLQSAVTMGGGFLFLGLLVGPYGFSIISAQALEDLSPVMSLGLGWMGLLIGIQFDWRLMRQIHGSLWSASSFISFSTAIIVFGCLYGFGNVQTHFPVFPVGFCLCLASIATVSDYSALALIKNIDSARGGFIKQIQLLADTRTPLAILLMALWYSYDAALLHESYTGNSFPIIMEGGIWFVISVLLGVSLGWMLHYLTSERLQPNEMLLVLAGTAILSSGLASSIHLSPLFINFMIGLTLTNLPNFARGRVSNRLLQTERPFFIVFMIFTGALWTPITWFVLLLITVYITTRAIAFHISVPIAQKVWLRGSMINNTSLPLAMISQGGVSFAIIVDYYVIQTNKYNAFPPIQNTGSMEFAETALGILLPAILILQIIGSNSLRYVLRQSGAIKTNTSHPSHSKRSEHSGVI